MNGVAQGVNSADIHVADKVAFLKRCDSYPHDPSPCVEAIETHMSWVFLTNHYAYKLKKPVRFPFLYFSSIDARHRDCEKELRLNARLAPGVYLEIVPLIARADGRMQLGGSGKTIDWLVKMRRLPAERMLDELIRQQKASVADVDAAAHLLTDFYQTASPVEISALEYRQRFIDGIYLNLQELTRPLFGLPAALVIRICANQLDFIHRYQNYFDDRVNRGRILETHGDLRPEHICLESPPVIFDCLQFKRELRLMDPLDELAFLAMECEYLNAAAIGHRFIDIYLEATGDRGIAGLMHFYASYRASLRARLSVWHLLDQRPQFNEKWVSRGSDYLNLAQTHADHMIGE